MKLTIILHILLAFSIELGFGLFSKPTTSYHPFQYTLPDGYKNCDDPNITKQCVPFRTINKLDVTTVTILASTALGSIRCSNFFNKSDESLVSKLYFNVYQESIVIASWSTKNNQRLIRNHAVAWCQTKYRMKCLCCRTHRRVTPCGYVGVVPGVDFWRAPKSYVRTSCVKFLMGGFMTDCNINAEKVSQTQDWRTHCAANLENSNQKCAVVTVNWGAYSCSNYFCLVKYVIKPLGKLLGNMFYDHFDMNNLSLVGLSLAAHIFGFACETVKERGGLVHELVGLDIAGPLFQGEKSLGLPGLYEGAFSANIAHKTFAVYTNPRQMGTRHFNRAQVNIQVNPPDFNQPGTKGSMSGNHAFSIMLAAALCANTDCFDSDNPESNLNFFYNSNIPPGIYKLFVKHCYPFCGCQ